MEDEGTAQHVVEQAVNEVENKGGEQTASAVVEEAKRKGGRKSGVLHEDPQLAGQGCLQVCTGDFMYKGWCHIGGCQNYFLLLDVQEVSSTSLILLLTERNVPGIVTPVYHQVKLLC